MFDKQMLTGLLAHTYLRDASNIKIGGEADYIFEPQSVDDIAQIYRFACEQNLDVLPVGGASNLLFAPVIHKVLVLDGKLPRDFAVEEDLVIASSGLGVADFTRRCAEAGFYGLGFLYGVPAHVGGAVFMNAGAYGHETAQAVQWVEVVDENGLKRLYRSEIPFAYRNSGLKGFIYRVAFKPERGGKDEIMAQANAWYQDRKTKHPLDRPNLGCFFKNPKPLVAGRLIADCGLKGVGLGGAQVSDKHGNFIINAGDATFADIMALVAQVQKRVKEQSGVDLELEIKVVQ